MKKFSTILIVLLALLIGLVGCNGGSEGDKEADDGALRVAMVVSGPMMDGAWNESGFNALKLAEEQMGAVTVYNENTAATDYERTIRDYAKDGNDVVIGHSFEFLDPILTVAKEFPDTVFLITSSDPKAQVGNGENVGSVLGDGLEQGFLQGAMAAIVSESNVVAAVGGLDIPAIKYGIDGFGAGAKYINPDIKVLSAVTGSFDDISKVKEQSLTMIEQGADVVMSVANIAGRGAYDAAQDRSIYAIGSIGGTADFDNYPDTLIASGKVDMAVSIVNVLEKVEDGTFEGIDYVNGIKEGAVNLAFNDKLVADKFPDLEKQIKEISDKLASGEINMDDYL